MTYQCVIKGETFTIGELLKRDFFSTNVLLLQQDKKYVLKVSTFNFFLQKWCQPLADLLSQREQRIYLRLQGVAGIPRILPIRGRCFFLHEYIEGETLAKRKKVSDTFFDELKIIIENVHQRGVSYMDLSKRENVIVDDYGKPWLIDFQVSLDVKSPLWYLPQLYNRLVRRLMKEDIYHVIKHKRALRRDCMTEADWLCYKGRSRLLKMHQIIRDPLLTLKRMVYPHGSNENQMIVNKL